MSNSRTIEADVQNSNDKLASVKVRRLGRVAYEPVFARMREFTDARDEQSQDEFWLVEHEPVFTQGQAGKAEHVLMPGNIPVVQSDRGGQVTYHGPGQIVCYLLMDIRRRKLNIRQVVTGIEQAIIALLAAEGIDSSARSDAPGVYVDDKKIASLGLRVRRGCTYHGLSLNVDMDLTPFSLINPCGMAGLEVTDIKSLGLDADMQSLMDKVVFGLVSQFNIQRIEKHG